MNSTTVPHNLTRGDEYGVCEATEAIGDIQEEIEGIQEASDPDMAFIDVSIAATETAKEAGSSGAYLLYIIEVGYEIHVVS